MTTALAPAATPGLHPDTDGRLLVAEIERYLAARTRATAHPLVTKTTQQLVAEALATVPTADERPAPTLREPSRLWRVLPDWCLPILRPIHGSRRRDITVAEHLELTALTIEAYGWASGSLRTIGGRRCILGAQAVLYRLGYGDEHTVDQAAAHLNGLLRARGIDRPYHEWNDASSTSRQQVLDLIRTAAAHAREADATEPVA